MGLKYVKTSRCPLDMPADALRAELGDLDDTKLMRSLIMDEVNAIRAGTDRMIRTMRGLWYSAIKPVLSRLGKLNDKTSGGKDKGWDRKLSAVLGDLVTAGVTTYEELSIIDGSRLRHSARTVTYPVADVTLTGAHYPQIILCSEKDTIYGVIEAVADLYGVSCYSGGGEPSKAATENLVMEILRSPNFDPDPFFGTTITVLSLTDYDPAGYTIARAFFAQVQETANRYTTLVRHERLGLHPSQLSAAELARNTYEPKGQGLEEWFAETGGVNGEPLGLELDALPLDRIRQMFADGIQPRIPMSMRRDDLRSATLDLVACELLLPAFNAQRQALIQAAKASDLWAAMVAAPIPDDLFRQAAIEGLDALNPLDFDLFDVDALRAFMRARIV